MVSLSLLENIIIKIKNEFVFNNLNRKYKMVKLTYIQIKNYIESKECKLLTTENTFIKNNMNTRSRFELI